MTTIERQLELEQRMIDAGATAYMDAQRHAEAQGRGHSLDYAQKLMHEFIQPLTEALEEWLEVKGPGMYARARVALKQIEPTKAVFIAMRSLFSSFTREQTPVDIASSIGRMIEDDIRFTAFQKEHGSYYNTVIADFKRRGTEEYRHMQRVLIHSANEKNVEWEDWPVVLRVDVGTKLLNLILLHTDLATREDRIVKNRNVTTIVPTDESLKWIKDHEAIRQFMHPERMPCIIQPDPWVAENQGGYYSPILRQAVPLIKAKGGQRSKKRADLTHVMRAVNAMQDVQWAVNAPVLEVLRSVWEKNLRIGVPASEPLEIPESPVKDIPKDKMTPEQQIEFVEWKREAAQIYLQDKERVSKSFQIARILRAATEYTAYDAFWFVWYADFRGRLYSATAGFSPQGPDVAKGLLRFSEGKALGEQGWYWLRVHIANRYGYDKVSYDERVQWVNDNHEALMRAAADPISSRSLWSAADKPYQFLAAAMEYAEATNSGKPHEYVSHLPIGLDGSCNGLQNFSAMLRDRVGGEATNLVPGVKPSDIYKRVAEVTVRKVQQVLAGPQYITDDDGNVVDVHDFAQRWLVFGIDRKLAKRPVMTLPYGATRQSCTKYIYSELLTRNKALFGGKLNFKAACWLTPLLWASIGEVVVAARDAMAWLQKSAGVLAKEDQYVEWTTADGFVAHQKIVTIETVKIETQLAGRFQCRVGTWTDEIDTNKQRLGISPNFVHSMDATHMRMTINKLLDHGITAFSFIHDDYGTYACDTPLMHTLIREAFIELYGERDPLEDFKLENESRTGIALPNLPVKGTLNIDDVANSLYFFG